MTLHLVWVQIIQQVAGHKDDKYSNKFKKYLVYYISLSIIFTRFLANSCFDFFQTLEAFVILSLTPKPLVSERLKLIGGLRECPKKTLPPKSRGIAMMSP